MFERLFPSPVVRESVSYFQDWNRLGWFFYNRNLIDFRGLGGRGRGWWFPAFFLLFLCSVIGFRLGFFVWVVFLVWEGFGRLDILFACFVFSECAICLLARWGDGHREAQLNPSNSSSHLQPCCGTECESRGCFVSSHAPNPNTRFQHPDADCLCASLWAGSTGQTCPLLIPSPGRKSRMHHHPPLGAVPSQCLCQCPVGVVQAGWIYRRVFQASFPSILYGFFVVVVRSFSKAACFILAPGLFLFGLSYLPWTP